MNDKKPLSVETLEQTVKYLQMGLIYKSIVLLIDKQMDRPTLSAFDKGKTVYNQQIKHLNLKYPIRKKKMKVKEDKEIYLSLIKTKG